MASSQLLQLLGVVAMTRPSTAHMKFVYPPPREDKANIKAGPCGDSDFSIGEVTELAPNSVVRLEIIETIYHSGAPYRIALSGVSNDSYSDCILLNHVPQHTSNAKATLFIDLEIPDVDCSECALQIISFMTDKIDEGATCEYLPDGQSGTCFSNYHSCANVAIAGATPRDQLDCQQPADWPYTDVLEWNVYTQEYGETDWCDMDADGLQLRLVMDGSG